jgi:GNAT superfamily N-acetyltransferase
MDLKVFRGRELNEQLENLGKLRIEVFKEYPYLYEGNPDYEKKYLNVYAQNRDSFVPMLFDADKLVGAATAIPMRYLDASTHTPILAAGYLPEEMLYIGEILLLPEYRGKGHGKKLMEQTLEFCKSYNKAHMATLATVIREGKVPKGYKNLDGFWTAFGFRAQPSMVGKLSWKDIGENAETPKQMQYWVKRV